jgi:hypothetical protein
VDGRTDYHTFTIFNSRTGWLILEGYYIIEKDLKGINNQQPRPQIGFEINKSALYCGHPSFKRRGKLYFYTIP